MFCLVFSLVIIFFSMISSNTLAKPGFIAFGYESCSSCHANISGGGRKNEYGKNFKASLFGEFDKLFFQKSDANIDDTKMIDGFNESGAKIFEYSLFYDLRILSQYSFESSKDLTKSKNEIRVIPMLFELGSYFAYGFWSLNLSISPKKEKSDKSPSLFSREHWLMFKHNNLSFRIGRLVLPFGLRSDDHTRLTRMLLGFQQYDQEYGFEFTNENAFLSHTIMLYLGDFLNGNSEEQKSGVVATFEKKIFKKNIASFSILYDKSDIEERKAASFALRSSPFQKMYFLREINYLSSHFFSNENLNSSTFVVFLKLGFFLREYIEFFLESSYQYEKKIKIRNYRLGGKLSLFKGSDLEFYFNYESSKELLDKKYVAIQWHVFY